MALKTVSYPLFATIALLSVSTSLLAPAGKLRTVNRERQTANLINTQPAVANRVFLVAAPVIEDYLIQPALPSWFRGR